MSHFSNLLPSRPAAGTSSASASQHQQRGPADSRYQFDPLLRSTFGHRSVDLYGSHIDNREQGRGYYDDEDDEDEDEGAAYLNSRGAAGQGTRSQHGVAGVGSSSLINASRYGPASASSRRDGGQLRDIEDEEDVDDDADDDDEYAAMAREEEDEQRQWGRGVNVRGIASGGDAGHKQRRRQQALDDSTTTGMGSSEEDVDSRTPSASIVAASSHAQPPATLDPFLVDDEDESGAAGRDDASASAVAGERRQASPAVKKSKGKSATSAATTPVTPSTTARGWLAHSMAPASKGKGKSRPLRDAYSIYDDEDEGVFSSEEEEDSDDSEDEESGDAHRNSGSASTSMHRPAKLSASSFPATHDDFHKKMPSANAAAAGDASSALGSGSILFDVPTNYSSALSDANMTSWKPWAAGNNPAWRQWKDRGALALWGFAIATTVVLAGGASLGAKIPQAPTSPSIRPSPYYTLTRSLPLLILLCALSLGMATLQLAFLRNLDRLGGAKVLRFALVATPACLTLAWAWAFAGSFFFDDEQWSGGSWSTTGLRTLSLIPLLLALFFSRLLYQRRAHLARSLSVLSLAARIVHAHPTLLLLSLVHIVVFLGVSMPFATIFIRLFLLGHFRYPTDTTKQDRNEWITDGRARILAWATLATWIWTWAALRGIMRVTVSSVVSHWYFYGPPSSDEEQARGQRREGALSSSSHEDDGDDDTERGSETQSDIMGDATMPGEYEEHNDASHDDAQLAHRNPTASDLVRASFLRATGPSLGTVLLSALLLAFSRLLVLISFLARTLASILSSPSVPAFLHPLASVAYLLSGAGGVIKGVSDYTLVYTGITGADFWRSSRRCSRLVMRRGATGLVEGLLIGTVLSLLTVSLSLLAALAGFLFSAHQLHVPADAPLVGLLFGVVPYWTLRLAADVLSNGADALSLCHYIDEQPGQAAGAAQEEDVSASQQEARQTMRGDDAGRGGGKDARSAKKQGAGGGGLLPL